MKFSSGVTLKLFFEILIDSLLWISGVVFISADFLLWLMDLDSIECVSSSDGLDEDEIHLHHTLHPYSHSHHHPELSATKPRNGSNNSGITVPTATAPATSVHELLECPVCTNSMYPPIHQVCLCCPSYLQNGERADLIFDLLGWGKVLLLRDNFL